MSCKCKCECDDKDVNTSTESPRSVIVEDSGGSNSAQMRKERAAKEKKKKKKKKWWKVWDSETKNADCGCSSKAEQTKSVARGRNQLTPAQKITDLADWFNYPQREQFLFNSEINEPMNGSSNTVDHINPVEVQGSEDIMGAEEVIWPQFTQNISGEGRTFANTIHPGMVIPNPDNYPTPEANNPWAPHVNIRTYGDILNAVYPPYPSAMEWATNPNNYKEYPSTDWYTP